MFRIVLPFCRYFLGELVFFVKLRCAYQAVAVHTQVFHSADGHVVTATAVHPQQNGVSAILRGVQPCRHYTAAVAVQPAGAYYYFFWHCIFVLLCST